MSRKREKIKTKNRKVLSFFQSHKKISVLLILVIGFIGFFFTLNYGRYVKDVIQVFYLRTQNFYFTSDKLTITPKTYEINPWSGTTPYDISISMSSLLNSIKGTTKNIVYNVSCEGDEYVDCYIGEPGKKSETRTIITDTHSDNYIVTVVKKEGVTLADGDVVSVSVKAESVSPYKETLSAKFELVIGNYGVNYEIVDNVGDIYFNTYISNTLDTDTVNVELEIDPMYFDIVFFDMSNVIMQQPSYKVEKVSKIGKYEYITKISFDLPPKSSLMVRYFKENANVDYSYVQGENKDAVVEFNLG